MQVPHMITLSHSYTHTHKHPPNTHTETPTHPSWARSFSHTQDRQPGCPQVNRREAQGRTHRGCAEGGSCSPAVGSGLG